MNDSKRRSIFDFTIRGRLFLGFAVFVLPLLIVMMIIVSRVGGVQNYATHLTSITLPTLVTASTLDTNIFGSQAALFDYLISGNEASKKDFELTWENINRSRGILDPLSLQWSAQDVVAYWNKLKTFYDDLSTIQNKLLSLPRDANFQTASVPLLNELRPVVNQMIDIVDGVRSSTSKLREGGLLVREFEVVNNGAKGLISDVSFIKILSYSLAILIIILAIGISIWTARSITGPLNHAISIAKRIANGERDIEIVVNSQDETGDLLKALSKMLTSIRESEENIKQNEKKTSHLLETLEKTANVFSKQTSLLASGDLRQRLDVAKDETVLADLGKDLNAMTEGFSNITKQITELGSNMVTTLEEVKSAANLQSTGVTEQAASINEITASIEEIDKSSKQTMEKARSLGEVAKQTREKGSLGIQSVEQSMMGMKSVREKVQAIAQTILDLSNLTQQVGEITAVVNTLAQQSKMLALNASIEAAKAGEAGKGFAVVAIEVKNLAEQSEQSTAQVQKILEDIRHGAEKAVMVTEAGTKEVDQGSKLIEKASEVVHDLNNMIQEAAVASQQIEASIRQEGISIEQITAGMGEINQVTTTFVSSVKETMTSINYLSDIAKNLKESISVYKL